MPVCRTPALLIVALLAAGTSLLQPSVRSRIATLTAVAIIQAPASGGADPFAKLREEWATALHSKQLDPLVMLYAPDAVFLTPAGDRFAGRPAIRELSKKAMDTFTSNIRLRSIVSEQSGNLGYDSGDFSETLVANSDGGRTEVKGNYLMVLKRQSGGEWLILEQVWTEASPDPKH
jgi:ketosteroid isomerase-like protein